MVSSMPSISIGPNREVFLNVFLVIWMIFVVDLRFTYVIGLSISMKADRMIGTIDKVRNRMNTNTFMITNIIWILWRIWRGVDYIYTSVRHQVDALSSFTFLFYIDRQESRLLVRLIQRLSSQTPTAVTV